MFSSRSFMVSRLIFRSLSHFEFIFVCALRVCSNIIDLHVATQPSLKEIATHSSVLTWRESQGQGNLVGCHLWHCTESDMTEATQQQQHTAFLAHLLKRLSFLHFIFLPPLAQQVCVFCSKYTLYFEEFSGSGKIIQQVQKVPYIAYHLPLLAYHTQLTLVWLHLSLVTIDEPILMSHY